MNAVFVSLCVCVYLNPRFGCSSLVLETQFLGFLCSMLEKLYHECCISCIDSHF